MRVDWRVDWAREKFGFFNAYIWLVVHDMYIYLFQGRSCSEDGDTGRYMCFLRNVCYTAFCINTIYIALCQYTNHKSLELYPEAEFDGNRGTGMSTH
jgi:hypothetical protein